MDIRSVGRTSNQMSSGKQHPEISGGKQHLPREEKSCYCLIYGIVMFLRCHELSRIQRINSALLIEGHTSVNVSTVIT